MNIPDTINGVFEFVGGLFAFYNCYTLFKDKQVKGISLTAASFFTIWAWWNMYYYRVLTQDCSFIAAIWMAIPSTIWITLAVYYKRNEKELKQWDMI